VREWGCMEAKELTTMRQPGGLYEMHDVPIGEKSGSSSLSAVDVERLSR
jgi:hypothetical protein